MTEKSLPYRHSPPPSRSTTSDAHQCASRAMTPDELESNGYPRDFHDLPPEARLRVVAERETKLGINQQSADHVDQLIAEHVKHSGGFLRATEFDIEAEIAETYYFTAAQGACMAQLQALGAGSVYDASQINGRLAVLTICVLVLQNGYVLIGESSCVSSENFDQVLGQKIARADAVKKLWPLIGFRLRDQMGALAQLDADARDNPDA